jgi:hypothetical protein
VGRLQPWPVAALVPLVLCGAALASDLGGAAPGGSARLRIAHTHPLELHGEGFVPNEHVTLRVELGAKTVKRALRTSARGKFVSRYDSLVLDRCSKRLAVKAVGAHGDSAEFELQTLPCPSSATR